jgi:hypothetical protein
MGELECVGSTIITVQIMYLRAVEAAWVAAERAWALFEYGTFVCRGFLETSGNGVQPIK